MQFSQLILFGIVFPMGFTIAYIWNVLELKTDKEKLINFKQRPFPITSLTIGTWIDILSFSADLAILSNSGIVSYQASKLETLKENQLLFFAFDTLLQLPASVHSDIW